LLTGRVHATVPIAIDLLDRAFIHAKRDLQLLPTRSGLTFDCVQDFFNKAVGHVKKVLLSYGPNGNSRGEASVIFSKPESATKAFKEYNSVKVDNRPMRVRWPTYHRL